MQQYCINILEMLANGIKPESNFINSVNFNLIEKMKFFENDRQTFHVNGVRGDEI